VPTSYILSARILAALLNVAPPLVGSFALGREAYGAAASVLAIATIIFGLVSQYLSQNLLRVLCTDQQSEGAILVAIFFALFGSAIAAVAHLAGAISGVEAFQLAMLVVSLTFLRICEVQLICIDKVVTSIVVYYAAPPLLCSVMFLIARAMGAENGSAGIAQAVAYGLASVLAFGLAPGVRPLFARALSTPAPNVARELARSLPLIVSGVTTAAAELLPIVLLRGMGALSAIPVYEIARKIASVPTTLANPLLNQVNPAMIRAYASRDKSEVHRLLRKVFRLLTTAGILFVLLVGSMMVGSFYDPRVHDVAQLLLPLSIGSMVAMWCVPYQSLLIAAHGDHWFTASSIVAVVLLFSLSQASGVLGPALAVSCAAGFSIAASALIIRYRALRVTYAE